MPFKLVLLRHGQTFWNQHNRVAGWLNSQLSDDGLKVFLNINYQFDDQQAARQSGIDMANSNINLDICFCSFLSRSIVTFNQVAEVMNLHHIQLVKTYRLNPRHLGVFQGMEIQQMQQIYGEETIFKIFQGNQKPPPSQINDQQNQNIYKDFPSQIIPSSESFQNVQQRVLPFWIDQIAPQILLKKQILIIAHGSSLKALMNIIGFDTKNDLEKGVPLILELNQDLSPKSQKYIINDYTCS